MFGTTPAEGESAQVTGHSDRRGIPLAAGADTGTEVGITNTWAQGATMVPGTDTIAGHTLFAPSPVSLGKQLRGQIPVTARLTLTYQDVFNRKHASIFDWAPLVGWFPVYTGVADKLLYDLERQHGEAIPLASAAVLSIGGS